MGAIIRAWEMGVDSLVFDGANVYEFIYGGQIPINRSIGERLARAA